MDGVKLAITTWVKIFFWKGGKVEVPTRRSNSNSAKLLMIRLLYEQREGELIFNKLGSLQWGEGTTFVAHVGAQ